MSGHESLAIMLALAAVTGSDAGVGRAGVNGAGKRPRPHKPKRRKRYRGLHKGHPMRRRHGGAR